MAINDINNATSEASEVEMSRQQLRKRTTNYQEEEKKTLQALDEAALAAVCGGMSRTRQALEAAYLRMDNDAIAAFIEGFLSTAPV